MIKIFAKRKVTTLVHGNKAKLKRLSLALKRCKSIFQIFEIGLIAVQIVLALLPCTSVGDFELLTLHDLKFKLTTALGSNRL